MGVRFGESGGTSTRAELIWYAARGRDRQTGAPRPVSAYASDSATLAISALVPFVLVAPSRWASAERLLSLEQP